MIHIQQDHINSKADHIIVWKDGDTWHTEQYCDSGMAIHGDLATALAQGQAAKNCDPRHEYFLVEVKFVLNFRATDEVM